LNKPPALVPRTNQFAAAVKGLSLRPCFQIVVAKESIPAGDEFKLLHRVAMGDDSDDQLGASVAAVRDRLFLRTGTKLYCIGK
jgi:hypothetical protein